MLILKGVVATKGSAADYGSDYLDLYIATGVHSFCFVLVLKPLISDKS